MRHDTPITFDRLALHGLRKDAARLALHPNTRIDIGERVHEWLAIDDTLVGEDGLVAARKRVHEMIGTNFRTLGVSEQFQECTIDG